MRFHDLPDFNLDPIRAIRGNIFDRPEIVLYVAIQTRRERPVTGGRLTLYMQHAASGRYSVEYVST